MASDDRGFSLIEVLIAAAIVTLMAFVGLAECRAIAAVTAALYTTGRDSAVLDTQAARLRDDAATAFAVFVPATDITGAPNRAADSGHEIDFYAKGDSSSKGGSGAELLWCYFYDAARQTLQRFDYDPGGKRGVRDGLTGTIDQAAAYPRIAVQAFNARTVQADQLGDPALNVYAGLAPLVKAALRHSISYDKPGLNIPAAAGGNAVIQVTLANAGAARVIHLLPGSLPSSFTVTGLPMWHAIVFRVDQTHRSWFGVAGKSHVFIDARVDVSYDNWQTHPAWCVFNLLGDPHGLDGDDPHANYTPAEPFEQAEALLSRCRQIHPTPPPNGSAGNAPEAGVVTQPLPADTPPPCWTNPGPGPRCWPADAPVDWVPPLPRPNDTPPPDWCATRGQSPACPASAVPVTPGGG